MSQTKVVLLIASLVSLTGCAGVVSLHPLALPNGKDIVFDPALLGTWEEVKTADQVAITRYTVARAESGYSVIAGPDEIKGTMHLMKVGAGYLLDVYCPSDGAPPPVHLFLKLRLEKDSAWVAEMDSGWLKDRIKTRGELRHEVLGEENDRVVLTASPPTRDRSARKLRYAESNETVRKGGFMNAISKAATLLAVSLLMQAGAAGQQGSISLSQLRAQPGAPLQFAGGAFGDEMLRVLLVNVSDREVTETVLGLLLEDGAGAVPAATQSGRVCKAKVAPGGFLVVTEADNGFDRAVSHFRDKAIAGKQVTVGVTRVRFADGSEWTYPLEAKGHFEVQADDKLAQKIKALTKSQFGDKGFSGLFFGDPDLEKVSTCRH
ncbi:MAG: hypothetical protein NTW28_01040 [Candidatus Solibacter sp.]|nr:hypothetical protein [Candidatus Solibacter sp.]